MKQCGECKKAASIFSEVLAVLDCSECGVSTADLRLNDDWGRRHVVQD